VSRLAKCVDGSREGLRGDQQVIRFKSEFANKLIFASARGAASADKTPISDKTKGPLTLKTRHPGWDRTPTGTRESSLTMESSSPVRVTEKKGPCVAHAGIGASATSREIAKRSGRRVSSKWRAATDIAS